MAKQMKIFFKLLLDFVYHAGLPAVVMNVSMNIKLEAIPRCLLCGGDQLGYLIDVKPSLPRRWRHLGMHVIGLLWLE